MEEYDNSKQMNILISADKRFLNKYKTMLFSLKKYNNDFTVFLLNQRLSLRKKQKFKKYLIKGIGCECICIDIDEKLFENAPIYNARYSIETYSRLFAQFYLPDNLDRILWLDADIICKKNIEKVYFQDFGNKSVIGTIDDVGEDYLIRNYQDKIGLDLNNKHHYVNAGITLLNIKKMRENTNIEYIQNKINELKDTIRMQDQDMLNVLYKDDMKYESKYFNYLVSYIDHIDTEKLNKIYFLHYNGIEKPWKINSHSELSNYWWDIEKERNIIKYYSYFFVRKVYMTIRELCFKIKKLFR